MNRITRIWLFLFVISKWMLPELSFSDHWSRGTKLWEQDSIRDFISKPFAAPLLPLLLSSRLAHRAHQSLISILYSCYVLFSAG